MYAMTIIDTDTYRQALIVRTIMEGAGWPTAAVHIQFSTGGPPATAAVTSAPHNVGELCYLLALAYDATGESGLENARKAFADAPESTRAVPKDQRDAVRNALLTTVHTVAHEEHVTLTTDPVYRPAASAAVPTAAAVPAPTSNPAGGGWDGDCERYTRELRW